MARWGWLVQTFVRNAGNSNRLALAPKIIGQGGITLVDAGSSSHYVGEALGTDVAMTMAR